MTKADTETMYRDGGSRMAKKPGLRRVIETTKDAEVEVARKGIWEPTADWKEKHPGKEPVEEGLIERLVPHPESGVMTECVFMPFRKGNQWDGSLKGILRVSDKTELEDDTAIVRENQLELAQQKAVADHLPTGGKALGALTTFGQVYGLAASAGPLQLGDAGMPMHGGGDAWSVVAPSVADLQDSQHVDLDGDDEDEEEEFADEFYRLQDGSATGSSTQTKPGPGPKDKPDKPPPKPQGRRSTTPRPTPEQQPPAPHQGGAVNVLSTEYFVLSTCT